MAFYNRDGTVAQQQQQREESGAAALSNDPDIRNAMRGVFTGKYADEAAQYPKAWASETVRVQVARSIARDKGIDTSGVAYQDGKWKSMNTGTPLAVELAPYVIGGFAGLGAAGAFGGAGGAASSAAGAGSGAATAAAPTVGVGGLTAGALTAPTVAGGTGMGTVGSILSGIGGSGKYSYLSPLVGTTLNVIGQNRALNANQSALDQQLASTKYATDAQKKAADEALAFQRQQALYDATVAEANRSGNYEQWAAKQELLGSVGQALGLPSRRIPAYVPLPAYNAGGAPTGAPGATAAPGSLLSLPRDANGLIISGDQRIDPAMFSGGAAGGAPARGGMPNIQGGDIAAQADAYLRSRGVTPNPTSGQYWAQKWNEFGAKDPEYFNRRLSQADEITGGGGAAPAAAPARRYQPMSDPLGSVSPYFADASAGVGQLQMPRYRPLYGGAVGSYLA